MFGFGGGLAVAQYLLAGLKILIMCGLLWYFSKLPNERRFWFVRAPIILIFAGGMGNLIDRIFTGRLFETFGTGVVRDMLEFLFINFAIFNLADVYVTVGVFVLAFVGIFVVKDLPYLK